MLEEKRLLVFWMLPYSNFFLKWKFTSLIMGPDSPFLSRDQNIYLYGNWRKNTSSMKTKTPLPEVTDPFQ